MLAMKAMTKRVLWRSNLGKVEFSNVAEVVEVALAGDEVTEKSDQGLQGQKEAIRAEMNQRPFDLRPR